MSFNNGFKFGFGLCLAILLCGGIVVFGSFAIEKFAENKNFTGDTGVKLLSVKHWLANDKLTFVGKITYEGDTKWDEIELSFVLNDDDGNFLGRCKDRLYRSFEFDKVLEFKAQCYDVPSDFKFAEYNFKTFGQY